MRNDDDETKAIPKQTYRKEHYDILLGQLMRSPTLLHLAVQHLEGHHFIDKRIGGTVTQSLLFDTIKRYYTEHKVVPDGAVILAEVRIHVDRYFRDPEKRKLVVDEVQQFLVLCGQVTEKSEPLARKLIQQVADTCVFSEAIGAEIAEFQETGGIAQFRQKLADIETKQAAMNGGLSFNGIVGAELDDNGARVSTHIPWFDSRFGGGMGPVVGSLMAILAPQSCGKTTLGIQLGVCQSLSEQHVLLVLAEEGFSLSVRSKLIGCALGIDYTLIRDAPVRKFAEKLEHAISGLNMDRQLVAQKLNRLNKYFHVLDLVQKNVDANPLEVIEGEIENLKSRGMMPKYVYVDWAGIIADKIASLSGRTKEQELKTLSYTLSNIAYRRDIIVAVSQQMAPTIASKGPFQLHDQYCAADCKGFTEPAKYCFVVGPQDTRFKYSTFTVAKSRDDARGDRSVVHLRGELATFYDITDKFDVRGKRFVGKDSKDNSTKVPSETRKKVEDKVE
jgi:KaiC/GvpD/RAD55 family RecA-like ATPase